MAIENSKYNEWFFQSDYDLETAGYMFQSKRNIYCIFMCHLSIEKALKGLIVKGKGEYPPKTHNLIYLADKIGIKFSDKYLEFIFTLNKVSVPTRYPDNLRKLISDFSDLRTKEILNTSKEIQEWIKGQ
jgi:HEPN domain-containing protein